MKTFPFPDDLRLTQVCCRGGVAYMVLGDAPYGNFGDTVTIMTSEGGTFVLPARSGVAGAAFFHLRKHLDLTKPDGVVACDGLRVFELSGEEIFRFSDPPSVHAGSIYEERHAYIEQIERGSISTPLNVREAFDDTHVIMTGSLFAARLPLLFGPSRAIEIMGTRKNVKTNHLMQWNRGGTPRIMKLPANPLHVALGGDGTFWAFSRKMAWQIDLD